MSNIKSRKEVVKLISQYMKGEIETDRRKTSSHVGYQELKDILDFIYGEEPRNEEEELKGEK